jgi:4-amino-4-deoxy-L-arabinose transferase-like glycosyltransferase
MPAFILFGFTFSAVAFARYIMIILFLIRLIAAYLFIKQIFSKRAALFFLPLLLFDPFLVYSAMQIRPDNLMMTLYTIALALLAYGLKRKNSILLSISSFFFGLSVLTFMKILPGVAVVGIVILIYCIAKRMTKFLVPMAIACFLPFILFALYGVAIGALHEMILQLFLEAKTAYNVFQYPIPFGNFNEPNNIFVYGAMGTPSTWTYVWILPMIGGAGFYACMRDVFDKEKNSRESVIKIILCLSAIVQIFVIFSVPSVFLQHYLLVNWLFALFGAITIDNALTLLGRYRIIQAVLIIILMYFYVILVHDSYTYNLVRSGITAPENLKPYETTWHIIPPNEAVFPNYLFRPPSYPVPFGYFIGNVPPAILARLPSITGMLETKKLKHLVLDDYTMKTLQPDVQRYIADHYARLAANSAIWVRK